MTITRLRRGCTRGMCLVVLCALLLQFGMSSAYAQQAPGITYNYSLPLQAFDKNTVTGNWPAWDPNQTFCGGSSATSSSSPTSTNQDQAAIVKVILGIVKTDNLNQQAGLIALMVGLDESSLTIYANSNVPVSLTNPAKQAVGSDHDSVGVFQQRPSTGWSTIADGPAADSNKDAVWQLMDPAYSAEAFLGSPKGSNAPSALSKGLQDVPNWQNQQPWVVAQDVQGSYADTPGPDYGANYKAKLGDATSLLNQYWSVATPVALPVPLTAAAGVGSGNNSYSGCSVSAVCNSSNGSSVATTSVRQAVVCVAQNELSQWTSGALKPGTNAFYKYSENRAENWCSDFASWVYSQANYPITGDTKNWSVPGVASLTIVGQGRFTFHSIGSGYTPQPGDLIIHGTEHVNLVSAVSGSKITIIGGNQGGSSFLTSKVTSYDSSLSGLTGDDPPATGFLAPNVQ